MSDDIVVAWTVLQMLEEERKKEEEAHLKRVRQEREVALKQKVKRRRCKKT